MTDRLVTLTVKDGRPWAVNPRHVIDVRTDGDDHCIVSLPRGARTEGRTVRGSLAEVVAALNGEPARPHTGRYGISYGDGDTTVALTGYVFDTVRAARAEADRVLTRGLDAATTTTDVLTDGEIIAADVETPDDAVGTLYPDGRWTDYAEETP